MYEFRFVDAHFHLYDMGHRTLYYGHWQPDQDHPVLGSQTRRLGQRNYLASDFIQEAKSHGMVKGVHVQAAIGSKDPVDETIWLEQSHQEIGFPNAYVGHVDLRQSDAEEVINDHLKASPRFRGVRDFSYGNYLESIDFRNGFGLLSKYGLVSSLSVACEEMNKVAEIATLFPDTIIVLDHTGLPQERTKEYFEFWKRNMSLVSDLENVVCKISGLGMADHHWSTDRIRPFVETAIDLFGTSRALFATNWPIDSLWSSYGTVIDAYRDITTSLSSDEKERLFSGNTERIYRI